MKIGIFDSGIGGLSVLHLAQRYLPEEQFLYFADHKHVPYGEKTKEQVITYVDDAIQFMLQKKVEAIVIACNTATSAAIQEMRSKYSIPIIGMEPAVKKALDTYGDKRVLVAATPLTVQGEKMKCLMEKVDKEHLVDLLPLGRLVRYAEEGEFDSDQVVTYLKSALEPYSMEDYSSIVLGCTHFNYFKKSLRSILPDCVHFVDGNEGTIHRLMSELGKDIKGECRRTSTTMIHSKGRNQRMECFDTVEFYDSGERVLQKEELDKIQSCIQWLDDMIKI